MDFFFRKESLCLDFAAGLTTKYCLCLPGNSDSGKSIWPPGCSSGEGLRDLGGPTALGQRESWGGHSLTHMFPEKINKINEERKIIDTKYWPFHKTTSMWL